LRASVSRTRTVRAYAPRSGTSQREHFDDTESLRLAERYSIDYAVLRFQRYCELADLAVPSDAAVRAEISATCPESGAHHRARR
jgi:hypothetical protein